MCNWFAVPSYHRDDKKIDKWMLTIFDTVVSSSEVNGLMMTYCHSWKIKRLHCKTIPPVLVNWMPTWLAVT